MWELSRVAFRLARFPLRRLSTQAAEEANAPRSKLLIASLATTAVAAPSAAGLYYVVHRYADDPSFRRWMRRDVAVGARYVEELLESYFPSLATAVRVDDDWQFGDDDRWPTEKPSARGGGGGGAAVAVQPELNLGNAPLPQPALGNSGTQLFRKLNEAPLSQQQEQPAGSPAELKESVASSAIGAAVNSGIGAALSNVRPAESASAALGDGARVMVEIAPDDPRGEDPASGEVDSSRWCMGGPAEPGAWGEAAPPELPTKLEVPVEVASRFERELMRYEIAEATLLGRDCTQLRESLDALAKSPPKGGGTKTIHLPETFWDPAFGSAQTEHDAAKLSGVEAAQAWRQLRLQWLRVQEAFTEAEYSGIELRVPAMQKRAQAGYGGGGALANMLARKRQLEWKILSLQHEKQMVKRSPWLEHSAISDPAVP